MVEELGDARRRSSAEVVDGVLESYPGTDRGTAEGCRLLLTKDGGAAIRPALKAAHRDGGGVMRNPPAISKFDNYFEGLSTRGRRSTQKAG